MTIDFVNGRHALAIYCAVPHVDSLPVEFCTISSASLDALVVRSTTYI